MRCLQWAGFTSMESASNRTLSRHFDGIGNLRDKGISRAMFSLGQMAYDERDYADPEVWFTRAAEKGHAVSLYWLDKFYWRGNCVLENRKEAMALFQRAASKKVPAAQRMLRFLSRHP